MKKLICVIPITILICILLSSEKVSAISYDVEVNNSKNAIIVGIPSGQEPSYYHYYLITSNFPLNINGNYIQGTQFGYYPFYQFPQSNGSNGNGGSNTSLMVASPVVIVKGSLGGINSTSLNVYNSVNDYNNGNLANPSPTPTPTPAPSWSQTMWNTLEEELGNPAFWFGEWFIDIIDQVFGNEEQPSQGPSRLSDSTHIKQVSPTPAPTPIPYSTITVPRTDIITGTTVYETNYYYTDSNGNNVVATSPPTNTPSQDNSGGGSSDNYNPVDPYSIPQVSWFTDAEIGDTTYDGIDSIMQGFDSIDTIGYDYTDGMSAVEDATGTLPTSWLLLIGIAAAIPLIAGIISRFLS